MEKLNRAQKCPILGPQNLGSRGARVPPPGSAPENHFARIRNNKSIIITTKTANQFAANESFPFRFFVN